MKNSDRKLSDWVLLKRILPYVLTKKQLIIFVFFLMVGGSLFSIFNPKLYEIAFDNYITNSEMMKLIYLGLGILLIQIMYGVSYFLMSWLFGVIRENSYYKLRDQMFKKIQDMDLQYYDVTPSGDTIARLTGDVEALSTVISGEIVYAIISLITIVAMVVMMALTNLLLTIAAVICIIPILSEVFYTKYVTRKRIKKFRESTAELTSLMTENILGVKVSRNFARAEENQAEYAKFNNANMNDFYKRMKAQAFRNSWRESYHSVATLGILTIAGVLVSKGIGSLSVGVVLIFLMYISGFYSPIMQISNYFSSLQNSYAAFERICYFLDYPTRIKEKENAETLIVNGGEISFQDVSFRYNKDSPYVLQNFDLNIKSGETLAIVGETGSGKTTIFNILCRLYEISDGKISIDNKDIKELSLKSIRRSFGVILQEPYLFHGSIKENMSLVNSPTEEQITQALKLVGADFVFRLPDGIDSVIGSNGTRISLGQKQLVSFARALVDDPPIILMDEATSSVDPQSELLIQKSLSKMIENRTTIIIAHRLSTIKNVDRIIVLDEGKIIEQGSFNELLNKGGRFSYLYSLQFS